MHTVSLNDSSVERSGPAVEGNLTTQRKISFNWEEKLTELSCVDADIFCQKMCSQNKYMIEVYLSSLYITFGTSFNKK